MILRHKKKVPGKTARDLLRGGPPANHSGWTAPFSMGHRGVIVLMGVQLSGRDGVIMLK